MMIFAWTRAIHFAACLLAFSVWIFDRLVAAPVATQGGASFDRLWRLLRGRLVWAALAITLASGVGWFLLVAANMSGLSLSQVFDAKVLSAVWNDTFFGSVWKLRLAGWVAAAAVALGARFTGTRAWGVAWTWIALMINGFLVMSLAWAGHGVIGSLWHRLADVLHLAAAASWPMGLVPFGLILWSLRTPSAERMPLVWALTWRFSNASLISVAVLAVSGLINGWFLVGSFSNLFWTPYGRCLAAKLLLFLVAFGIGAVNLMHLRPRLAERSPVEEEAASRRLFANVVIEWIVVGIILVIVGILGILPPPS